VIPPFKLVYGSWSKGSDELAAAAGSARALFTGAVDLALAGHLSPTGKGRATPAELADDLLGYLHAAARSR
jgi:hypothetical protein